MGNVQVGISDGFLKSFARLPRQIQGKVTEFVNKFRNDPLSQGINYEKIAGCADGKLFSVRIDDTYRGIVVRQDETGVFILLWVDGHDEAYKWALSRRCEVNPQTHGIQVFEVKDSDEPSAPGAQSLFADVTNDGLLCLGVPEAQLDYVRGFSSKEAFYSAEDSFPRDAFENLSWLVEGIPLREVLEYAADGRASSKAGDKLSDALSVPVTLSSFVVVDGEDELRRIMAEPLENWRVFLHPTQRAIVGKEYSGPAKVLGEAGTGKTVVAMHRAKHLAARCAGQERVLMTTFTVNLAGDIYENLRKICTGEELKKIEVINLDAWVEQFLRGSGFTAEIKYGDAVDALWDEAITLSGVDSPFERTFYEEEWSRVIIPQEALSLERYVGASRNGRGTRLDRRKRMEVWKVVDTYQNLMKERQVRDIDMAMYEATALLRSAGGDQRYRSVVVDEGQDFGDAAFRMIRAIAGEEHPDDIFIVGDSHQRIYKNRPTLSRCGINVRGRSSILKINYRTTEETRRAAFALLNGMSFDDLDDGEVTRGRCQSLTHGEKPVVKNFKDAEEEFGFVVGEIRSLIDNGVGMTDICVVARTKRLVDDYIAQFTKAGIRAYEIKQKDNRGYDGLRIATMHRVKGLEFKYVFVVAVNDGIVPAHWAIDRTDAVSEAESIASEKCLLYVAMTRAQKSVYVTSYGRKSEFLV